LGDIEHRPKRVVRLVGNLHCHILSISNKSPG
jgi:hypothetical protein